MGRSRYKITEPHEQEMPVILDNKLNLTDQIALAKAEEKVKSQTTF